MAAILAIAALGEADLSPQYDFSEIDCSASSLGLPRGSSMDFILLRTQPNPGIPKEPSWNLWSQHRRRLHNPLADKNGHQPNEKASACFRSTNNQKRAPSSNSCRPLNAEFFEDRNFDRSSVCGVVGNDSCGWKRLSENGFCCLERGFIEKRRMTKTTVAEGHPRRRANVVGDSASFIDSKLDNHETMCEYDYRETLPTYICLANKHKGGAWNL
ncbi:hypothetical protein L596_013256 [Steinernema carpocapsae]|uniref:Uncharacterized protein n=1 Tax=Steinernema carpocapsae TaxID=34508 RepID=A0A4U5NZM1_STECR|nr:hypothetical protein L596_013256 [Steinernema carpocapsae]